MNFGECIVSTVPDGIRVDRADDHILISRQLMQAVTRDGSNNVTVANGHVLLDAANGRYVYRLGAPVDGDAVSAELVYADDDA